MYKPKGFQALTPYLIVKDAISYPENAFGAVSAAKTAMKNSRDNGKVYTEM